MSSQPSNFGSTVDLVPVDALLPEDEPGGGAILIMRDASYRMIIRSTSVNFDLKSPEERMALTAAFGGLVDSLREDFPLEIVSHSKVLDLGAYAAQFEVKLADARVSEQKKRMIRSHLDHFAHYARRNKLMKREIYIVVPFKAAQGPLEKKTTDDIPGSGIIRHLTRKIESSIHADKPSDQEIARARQQLELRSDQVLARLRQIKVEGVRLDEDEVKNILYSFFHPALSERQTDPGHVDDSLLGGFSAQGSPRALSPGPYELDFGGGH